MKRFIAEEPHKNVYVDIAARGQDNGTDKLTYVFPVKKLYLWLICR